jgi:pyruvate,water dikinase
VTGQFLRAESSPDDLARDGGGKAAHLARLHALGVRVPEWCCIPATVFDDYCARSGVAALRMPTPADESAFADRVAAMFAATPISPDLRDAIRAALASHGFSGATIAVRSSGIGEDSAQRSFAGQYSSFLFQRGEQQVLTAMAQCWASAYSARNLSYRRQAAGGSAPPRMGVILQCMVDSEVSGVAFSRNPLAASDRASIVIDSVVGQGEGLVSGELDADHFEVDRATMAIRATIAHKEQARVRDESGGTRLVALNDDQARQPSLSDERVREVARLAQQLQDALGAPQDIEWAWANGALHCLQTRPITTLPPDAVFDARVNGDEVMIWDNSNIIESFAGVTTPLTFTHVNRCYREVYLQYCRVMGVPERVIAAQESVFRNMLGLVRGRVYYNLVNWYRLLGMFPGASASKGFMETMMGVQQALPAELSHVLNPTSIGARYSATRRLAVLLRTLYRLTRTRSYVAEFMARVERVSRMLEAKDMRALSVPQQVAIYRVLETDVLLHWTAPIVNDTRCMVAFGVLGALTTRWVARAGDDVGSLRNDLLCGEGDLKSTEPTKLLMRIAEHVDRGDAATKALFRDNAPNVVWGKLEGGAAPEIFAEFRAFLREFGFRCVNELKLEEPDLHDDPRFIVASVQSYLKLGAYSIHAMEEREAAIRQRAEQTVRGRLSGLRRLVYFASVRWARRAVSDREMLRFERTRMFGVTRRLFRGIGANFVKLGLLDDERDVFYLTLDEIIGFHEGRSLATGFRSLAALRRAEFDEYRATPAPPDRFVTRGAAASVMRYPGVLQEADLLAGEDVSDDPNILRGTPCSPGVVEAPVRVAETLADAEGLSREILVTERTDPGWVPVFPACAGLIIERGSLLSHSAVVARELGVPTIVGVRGKPMQRLKTGQRVRMDGGKGEVHIL